MEKGILTLIDGLVWGLVAILFMVMLFFFGITIYYQIQLLKIYRISEQIKIINSQLSEIGEQLKEIKLE